MTRRGWSFDPDVGHRRFIDLVPGLRPLQDSALFDRIGGQTTIDRLVDSLYDRFEADAVIRPFFGRDLANGRIRQKRFFAEWLGGPPRYSESAWGALYQHHEDLPITRAVAERWLDHLRGALGDAVPADRRRCPHPRTSPRGGPSACQPRARSLLDGRRGRRDTARDGSPPAASAPGR